MSKLDDKAAKRKTDREIVDEMVLRFGFSTEQAQGIDAWRINVAISKAVTEALKEPR